MGTQALRVVLVGAGNVAYSLLPALLGAGVRVEQVYSRTRARARGLAHQARCQYTTTPGRILPHADAYLVMVPDHQVSHVAHSLPLTPGVIAHTSGATPMRELQGRAQNFGVFYPFQTFTHGRRVSLQGVPICIEASNGHAQSVLMGLAQALGARAVPMDSATRQWLHLEGAFCCNFVNHLLALAQRLARAKGLDYELMQPLIRETIAKAGAGDAAAQQTGPAIRGDWGTLERHQAMLRGFDETMLEVYKCLSSSIMADRKG